MSLGSMLLLYVMAGAGVAVAVYVNATPQPRFHCAFVVLTAVVFWPLYLPILLAPASPAAEPRRKDEPASGKDELARAIAQADAELQTALESLDGWAEHVLAREKDRLHELRLAWVVQADRIRDMDRLLRRREASDAAVAGTEPASESKLAERLRTSQEVIRQNLDRLREVRQRTYEDLLSTLAWVRELASMIHLAKFTGAPASRAEELVAQIAAAVEGLSALTWQSGVEAAV